MSTRPIIDAGPGLNFLSINKERLLIGVLGPLSATESVETEIRNKARSDQRFRAAESVWNKLTPKWVEVLSDAVTPELAAAVSRISGLPMEDRLGLWKDLGETMVIAHAVVVAELGTSVTILIDEGDGARIALSEMRRLDRLRAAGALVGGISLVNTQTVLTRGARTEHIPDKAAMRDTYARLRVLDDGLVPIESTNLLSADLWT